MYYILLYIYSVGNKFENINMSIFKGKPLIKYEINVFYTIKQNLNIFLPLKFKYVTVNIVLEINLKISIY